MKRLNLQKIFLEIITCCFLAFILLTCKKEKDTVPATYVDIYVHTNDPQFINLNAVGGWVYITGGSRGILIYKKSTAEFMAYDRNCTYQSSNACAQIEIDSSNIIAVDSCCSSKFLLPDGSVTNPPATLPLKQYQTTFDGSILHIFN